MAEETGLQTKAIIAATSSGSIKRCSKEVGRSVWKNSSSTASSTLPPMSLKNYTRIYIYLSRVWNKRRDDHKRPRHQKRNCRLGTNFPIHDP